LIDSTTRRRFVDLIRTRFSQQRAGWFPGRATEKWRRRPKKGASWDGKTPAGTEIGLDFAIGRATFLDEGQ
jgi:hypothetical protein